MNQERKEQEALEERAGSSRGKGRKQERKGQEAGEERAGSIRGKSRKH